MTRADDSGDSADSTTGECALCGLPLSAKPGRSPDGEYCCTGCRQVADALGDAADVDRADVQEAPAGRSDGADTDDPSAAGDAANPDQVPPGCERAFFHVEGMYCTTCEAFLETVADSTDGVEAARASYATETVRVDYDPDRIDGDRLPDLLTRAGYTATDREDTRGVDRAEDDTMWRLGFGVLVGMFVMIPYAVFVYPVHFGIIYPDYMLEMVRGTLQQARYPYYVITLMTTLVLAVTGAPLFKGAYVSLRARQPNMTLLVAVAALGAYCYSILAVIVGPRTDIYFDVSIAVVLVVTAGTYYESQVKGEAMGRLSELTTATVDRARRLVDGEAEAGASDTETVPTGDLSGGDRVLVRQGERVPVDGTVAEGEATVDESLITGEPVPETKRAGDPVVGGTAVADGSMVVGVEEGAESSVDRIASLVWSLQSDRRGVQRLADRLAVVFVPGVLVLSVLAGLAYLVVGAGPTEALLVALTVLIVSCPCSLGLATPLAVASGLREAIERGIVVFDDGVFEGLRGADTVVFDKTGTLTTGEMTVRDSTVPESTFGLAAALEGRSAHPIAQAIATAGNQGNPPEAGLHADGGRPDVTPVEASADSVATRPTEDRSVEDFESYATGVGGVVDGTRTLVGHPDLFAQRDWTVPDAVREEAEAARDDGAVPVLAGRNGTADGVIAVGDEPREGWDATVTALSDRDVEVVVLTGDEYEGAAPFRDHPAIDRVFAGVPPEGKAATVRRLTADGQVTMVGDGTNDAPALAAADLGIAMGGGTALAVDAADVAIVGDDLGAVATVFDLADATGRRVKQNVGWAFVYNGVAIPLALTGLLNPLFAAAAMAASSILVVTNSTRSLLE